MKRLWYLLGLALLLSALSAPALASYSDVPAGSWYASAADYCATNDLMQGVGGDRFAPNEAVTRATVLTVLYRLSGSPAPTSRGAFTDVPDGAWYASAADWASETALATGVGDGRLDPDNKVSRQDLAVFLWRLSGSPEAAEPSGFRDEAEISAYALDAVRWASDAGIVSGVGDGGFAPFGSATRAQLAVMLMRMSRGKAILRAPLGVAAGENGALLVTDVYTKRVWEVRGDEITPFAGAETSANSLGEPRGGYRDGAKTDALFLEPWGITPFLDGWAVSDAGNNALRLISGDRILTINGAAAGAGLKSSDMGVVYDRPTGLATDEKGNLYVADTGSGTIRRVTTDGRVTIYAEGLNEPTGLCWNRGSLYVAETGANRVVTITNGVARVFAGTGDEGFDDGAAESASFRSPVGIAAGEDGTIYVADMVNAAVRAISGGQVRTVLRGDGGADSLSSPVGLLVRDGALWITDRYTGRLRSFPIQ